LRSTYDDFSDSLSDEDDNKIITKFTKTEYHKSIKNISLNEELETE